MKMTPEHMKAYSNMLPGVLTTNGFLGPDTRPLADIIEADEENMEALGLSFDSVARKLRELEKAANQGLGEPTTVDGKWLVKVDQVRGHLTCPFEDGIYHKLSVQVEYLQDGDTLLFSELSIHMLEKHHFLQGVDSPFRLDPKALKKILEL